MKRFEGLVERSVDSHPSTQSSVDAADSATMATAAVDPAERFGPRIAGLESSAAARLFHVAPAQYEEKYAYPLVVWLHGPGGDEREVATVMPLVSVRNYAAVGVRGGANVAMGGTVVGGDWAFDDDSVDLAADHVFAAIAASKARYNIHEERVFLAGYLSGGSMALRLGLAFPQRFAGVISVNGPLPQSSRLLCNVRDARGLTLLACVGREAPSFSEGTLCRQLALLHAAGMPIHVRQYPSAGDDLTSRMLHDANVWMMDHIAGVVTCGSDDESFRAIDN